MIDAPIRADTVVVGSGVGGATVARELARLGEEVVVLEKGRDHHWPIGTPLAYATIYDILRSKDGVLVRRGITTGGSTILYSGIAYDPPAFLKDELGIDLGTLAAETKQELGVRTLPESFYEGYAGTKRLVEAAGGLGYRMKPRSGSSTRTSAIRSVTAASSDVAETPRGQPGNIWTTQRSKGARYGGHDVMMFSPRLLETGDGTSTAETAAWWHLPRVQPDVPRCARLP